MKAVVTLGNGGYDMLSYRDVPVPVTEPGEVLIKVLAAGMNNTEINTRLGWYSADVTAATSDTQAAQADDATEYADGGWNDATPFPFIQGTDCCGEVVAAHDHHGAAMVGKRVLVRACMRTQGFESLEHIWMASDFDGAFAEFVKVPASEVFPVRSDWTDAELATLPCAYGTAENLVHRSDVERGDRVLVTGASGGVGSAAVQLARRRGAEVIGIASPAKADAVLSLGADRVVHRGECLVDALGDSTMDVVIDIVGGPDFPPLLKVLGRGGRYASSGAIAGPVVDLDLRDFYLKDLRLIGCTAWDEPVFPNLIGYVERGEIRPVLAKTFPLADIIVAQQEFLEKKHVGNFVLIP